MCWTSPGDHPWGFSTPASANGSILVITLLFMLVLAMLATAILEGSTLQLRMAGNHERQERAFQQARNISTELSLDYSNFLLDSDVGDSNCAPADPDPDCDRHGLVKTIFTPLGSGRVFNYSIIRRSPLLSFGLPARDAQSLASSVRAASFALFEVDVTVDESARLSGRSRVMRGVAVRVESLP